MFQVRLNGIVRFNYQLCLSRVVRNNIQSRKQENPLYTSGADGERNTPLSSSDQRNEQNTNAGVNVTLLGLSNNGWVLFLLLI